MRYSDWAVAHLLYGKEVTVTIATRKYVEIHRRIELATSRVAAGHITILLVDL